jgi:hypothetical protein
MKGGFVKAMSASHTPYDDNPQLEETEFALAIAPCPQIEGSKDIGENMGSVRSRSGKDGRASVQGSRRTVLDDHELTETLTISWAIALAIAVALAVYISGG